MNFWRVFFSAVCQQGLDQWFSLEGLLGTDCWVLPLGCWSSRSGVGLRIYISEKLCSAAKLPVWGPHFAVMDVYFKHLESFLLSILLRKITNLQNSLEVCKIT